MREWAESFIKERFRVDTRSLAVFRVLMGVLALADLVLRSRNFVYFYTSEGVVPLSLARTLAPEHAVSVYYLTDDPALVALLLVIQAVVALQFIVGYKTRLATVLLFLFVVSLDFRNPMAVSAADLLFRLLLFWGVFLPLSERWSVDSVHRECEPRGSVANVASALILVQMVSMYLINGYMKTGSELWRTGEGAAVVLGLDHITFALGDFGAQFPTVVTYGGLVWFHLLVFSWLLLVLVGRKRALFASVFFLAHSFIAVTVRVGAFPYVIFAGLVLFIQAQVWEDAKVVVRNLVSDLTRETHDGVRSDSVATGRQIALLFPRWRFDSEPQRRVRGILYKASLYTVVVCLVLVLVVLLPYMGLVSDDTAVEERSYRATVVMQNSVVAEPIKTAADAVGVGQQAWGIFAPEPLTEDRYYVFPAKTADGRVVDAYNDPELSYERPYSELQRQFGTYRERFYMESLERAASQLHRIEEAEDEDGGLPANLRETKEVSEAVLESHAEFLCEDKNQGSASEVTHVNMYVVTENVTLGTINDPEQRETETKLLYRHGCGGREPKEIHPPDSESEKAVGSGRE